MECTSVMLSGLPGHDNSSSRAVISQCFTGLITDIKYFSSITSFLFYAKRSTIRSLPGSNVVRMAIQTYEASYRKYFGNTYDKIHKDSTHDEVRQVYDIWAVDYDKEIGAAGACFHKPLAECLDAAVNEVFPNIKKTQLKILDAGAGTGPIGIELLKLGYTDIHALDISQEMLNIAKDKGVPYRRFICCPLTEKKIDELETGEFDALISAGTLIKANVRPEALVEMIRIVKTGGLVCFSLRYNEVDDYQPKMTELEEAGIWEKLSGKKIPYYNREDMPSYGFGFVYKILKN